jgi:hypothetical protein
MQDNINEGQLLSRLIIGGGISFFVVWILQSYDERLAMIYVGVVILLLLLTYKDQIFPSINLLLGTIKGSTNA